MGCGSDAGQDRIYVWKLNSGTTPPLTPAATPFVNVPPGDGPRHFAFHGNGRWMYSIQEEGDTIIFWLFDPTSGSLTRQQTVSSLPPNFAGTVFTSEIRVSQDGRFVYGVNRLHDTIAVFQWGQWVSDPCRANVNSRRLSKDHHQRSVGVVYVVRQPARRQYHLLPDQLDHGRVDLHGFLYAGGSSSAIVFLT